MADHNYFANLIWQIADLLRGPYRPPQYERVMLTMIVLRGLVSPDYVVAAPIGSLSPEFAGLLFRTDMFSAECARRSHGIVWDRLRLYWEGFREIELPLPPSEAQREIVVYAARETAKLDALRVSTEGTISLLKERRAALIAAAVTGQIDTPDAP